MARLPLLFVEIKRWRVLWLKNVLILCATDVVKKAGAASGSAHWIKGIELPSPIQIPVS
jgi:hypothetical protein